MMTKQREHIRKNDPAILYRILRLTVRTLTSPFTIPFFSGSVHHFPWAHNGNAEFGLGATCPDWHPCHFFHSFGEFSQLTLINHMPTLDRLGAEAISQKWCGRIYPAWHVRVMCMCVWVCMYEWYSLVPVAKLSVQSLSAIKIFAEWMISQWLSTDEDNACAMIDDQKYVNHNDPLGQRKQTSLGWS